MKPNIILFFIVLGATGTWFISLGEGRTKALGQNTGISDVIIYVLITASGSFLGDIAIRKYAPVLSLKRKRRLLKRRLKHEQRTVTQNQQKIISMENQGFWHDRILEQTIASHRIAKDHALAEQQPCAE